MTLAVQGLRVFKPHLALQTREVLLRSAAARRPPHRPTPRLRLSFPQVLPHCHAPRTQRRRQGGRRGGPLNRIQFCGTMSQLLAACLTEGNDASSYCIDKLFLSFEKQQRTSGNVRGGYAKDDKSTKRAHPRPGGRLPSPVPSGRPGLHCRAWHLPKSLCRPITLLTQPRNPPEHHASTCATLFTEGRGVAGTHRPGWQVPGFVQPALLLQVVQDTQHLLLLQRQLLLKAVSGLPGATIRQRHHEWRHVHQAAAVWRSCACMTKQWTKISKRNICLPSITGQR